MEVIKSNPLPAESNSTYFLRRRRIEFHDFLQENHEENILAILLILSQKIQ